MVSISWCQICLQTFFIILVKGYLQNNYKNVTIVQAIEKEQRARAEYGVRREPRFLSFQTKNDKIDVGVEFKVPFLSIPVKRSIDTMLNGGQEAFANVNFGSLVLALVFTAAGATLGGFLRATDDSTGLSNGFFFSNSKKGRVQETLWDVFETIEKSLLKYDIDPTACTQRYICGFVKNSRLNVAGGKGTKSEIIVNGLTSADWALQMISGNAIEDAIEVGKQSKNCETVYSNCKLNAKYMEKIIRKIQTNNGGQH